MLHMSNRQGCVAQKGRCVAAGWGMQHDANMGWGRLPAVLQSMLLLLQTGAHMEDLQQAAPVHQRWGCLTWTEWCWQNERV